jgi:3-hydroxy acid dehydrogenase / malonic semialdehyde reductase
VTRTALVTGATAGFGEAITRRLVRDGWRVIATGRRRERLDALAAELGEPVLAFPLDVTDHAATDALPGSLPEAWQRVDALINNAGLALGLEPAHRTRVEDWDRMVAVNVSGVLHMTRALLPAMVERNDGQVINLGSTAGTYPYPGANVYGASKAFLRHFSLNLRADLIGTSVRVTDIEPGLVGGTEFSGIRFRGDQERAAAMYAGLTPLNPDDIAETVSWVLRLPIHMNVNRIEMMPTCQASGPLAIRRPGE